MIDVDSVLVRTEIPLRDARSLHLLLWHVLHGELPEISELHRDSILSIYENFDKKIGAIYSKIMIGK